MDRTKYMDLREARQLRTVTEARAVVDLRAGRVSGPVAWMLVDLALATGLRVSEIAAIRVGDIDFRRSALTVNRLKRRKPVREALAVDDKLLAHLREFVGWKRTLGQPIQADSALLVGKRGPLTAQGLMQLWKSAIRRAGLPAELSIHSARHTLAVHLLRKTGNLRQVQKQLGHTNPATTANLYADVPWDDMKAGVTGLYDAA